MKTDQLAFVSGLLGNIISFMVLLAPLPTFHKIFKRKSTEGFQSVLYIVGLFSAMLWLYYAFLKTDMTLLITINTIASFTYAFYICFFLFFSPKKAMMDTLKLFLLINVFGFGLIVLLTYSLANGSNRVKIIGWICLVFSLCVFIAPLCIVRKVMKSRSVEYMPFLPSFFLTVSAVIWFFYGFFIKDYNIAIPNVMGFSFGVVQMAMYVIYKYVVKKDEKPQIITDVMLSGISVGIIPVAIADNLVDLEGKATDNLVDLQGKETSEEQAIQNV